MAKRLDLEARLRALRAHKRPLLSPPAPSSAPVSHRSATGSMTGSSSPRRSLSTDRAVADTASGTDGPVRRAASARPDAYVLFPSRRCAAVDNRTALAARRAREPAVALDKVSQGRAAELLGREYEEAVKVAQFAMDKERRQMPHAAIDAYIRAGQILIEIGRKQAVPYLQAIVKAKALDLLQRAEALSEWTNDVLAKDSSQDALAEAYLQSQRNRSESYSEKQRLVSKMHERNLHMKKKLNQLTLLTTVRNRMIKAVRARRARKAAEAKVRQEAEANARVSRGVMRRCGGWDSDVTEKRGSYSYGDGDESEDSRIEFSNITGSSSDEEEETRKSYESHDVSRTTDSSPREVQKIELVNELHERIGLPQIDRFRKFEPLTTDLTTYKKQAQLHTELEAAKQESIKLQAAVQEMERSLWLAEERSKQLSMRLEEKKAREFAEVQSQLERLREELKMDRQRSSSFYSEPTSWNTSQATDPVEQHRDATNGYTRRAFVHRTSPVSAEDALHHSRASAKHSFLTRSYEMDEEETEEDDDGGIWL
ncbi:unnamed protein product [Hyaloperonospora brassicae]|uniref:MIT domain-containing protein n=1 Tax=Hyaloperonospora brassicae TaxID=162125 RepID=A0AAV0TCE6_HYABA|nr:unnamed protein product [Hyaloperonospora brassicae]